jgi:hypothetical protein
MSTQKFLEAVKNDAALKNDLNKAMNDALVSVAKKHGHDINPSDMNTSKDQKSSTMVGCVSTTKTLVCTV